MTVTPEQHFLRYRERGDAEALGLVFDADVVRAITAELRRLGGEVDPSHTEDES